MKRIAKFLTSLKYDFSCLKACELCCVTKLCVWVQKLTDNANTWHFVCCQVHDMLFYCCTCRGIEHLITSKEITVEPV